MTALQQIIKEAKILRKKNPKMEWKKAVAQASAIYASKHKGKSPVGKKHKKVTRKKAAKKVGTVKRKVVRKKAAKKRITEKGILNRIHTVKRNVEKLDEAQHKHMLGGKKHFTHSLLDELNSTLNKINNAKIYQDRYESALKYKKVPKDKIKIYKNEIKKIKDYIKELKTHFTQIKKNYKPI
jgi:hypothetical protein